MRRITPFRIPGRGGASALRSAVIHLLLATAAVLLAACGSSTIDEPDASPSVSIVIASPTKPIAPTDAFRQVGDTIVAEVRDAAGRRLDGPRTVAVSTNGYFRGVVGTVVWRKSAVLSTDSTGQLRLLWKLSAAANQVLTMRVATDSVVLRTTLQRPAVALVADTAVSSGPFAVCMQQGGRIGCVDQGLMRWLRLDGPVVLLSSNNAGACALLTNGSTTCWTDAGADSALRSDRAHPPFVEVRGTVARTAAGDMWVKLRRPANAGWIKATSDSPFVALLEQYNENIACARTADGTIMCSMLLPSSLQPYLHVTAMAVVRDSRDSSAVRGTGGYTGQPGILAVSSGNLGYFPDAIVVRRLDGSVVMFRRSVFITAPWFERSEPDSSLSGPDASTRSCVRVLDVVCDVAAPWRSVSQVASLADHPKGFHGYERTCAVRSVVVCRTYDATSRLVLGNVGYRPGPNITVDTIWLAP